MNEADRVDALPADDSRWTRRTLLRAGAGCAAAVWIGGGAAADVVLPEAKEPLGGYPLAPADSWPLFRGSPDATGASPCKLAPPLEILWQRDFPDGGFEGTAAIVDGLVLAPSLPIDGCLYALELKTGATRWKYPKENPDAIGFKSSPSVRNGVAYLGDDAGTFHAVDLKTGTQKWKFATDGEIISSATFHKDRVLFGSYDQNLYCLDAATGKKVWSFGIEGPVHSTPTVVVDRAFVAGCDSKLHVIDLDTGKAISSLEIAGQAGAVPAVQGDSLYVGNLSDTFFRIAWKKPEILWSYRHETRKFAYHASAAVLGDTVYVAGRDKMVRALDTATGREKWIFTARARVDSSPVLAGGFVWVGSDDGRLYCLDATTGKKAWELDTGGKVASSPAIASDRLVIGNDKGSLFCLGRPAR